MLEIFYEVKSVTIAWEEIKMEMSDYNREIEHLKQQLADFRGSL
ncbi:hypothetical protein LAC02_44680 [Ligilactobacillus acidipiscis]|nr:hypothetical protein LAC02_44680 [Ligilactobacillus acidipiscis]